MYLFYGDATDGGVLLECSTEGVDREFIYSDDESTHLHTLWTVAVSAVVSPLPFTGPYPAPYGAQDGNRLAAGNFHSVVYTDRLLRSRLMQPRKQLVLLMPSNVTVQADGSGVTLGADPAITTPLTLEQVRQKVAQANAADSPSISAALGFPYESLLLCPRGNAGTDALDGPTPLRLDITPTQGVASLVVRYVVRCAVSPEADSVNGQWPSPVASHRWKTTFSGTDGFYAVRQIEGAVHFRKDSLLKYGMSQDDFRALLIHPVPPGFKRDPNIVFELSEDGGTMMYAVTDTQQAVNVNPLTSGVAEIDVEEKMELSRGPGALNGTPLAPGQFATPNGGIWSGVKGVWNWAENNAEVGSLPWWVKTVRGWF